MKYTLPVIFTLALTPVAAQAEENNSAFRADHLQLGGSISENVVDSPFGGGSEDALGFSVFAGYEFANDMRGVKTTAELGYSDTDDFYRGGDNDINGLWVAGVVEKNLPEINPNLFALARIGLDFGDDDGILLGAGGGFHLSKEVDVRAEFINKDASSVYQASLVFNF